MTKLFLWNYDSLNVFSLAKMLPEASFLRRKSLFEAFISKEKKFREKLLKESPSLSTIKTGLE